MKDPGPDMACWRAILAILPHRRPRRLPHLCGRLPGGVHVWLVDGNAVKLRERKDAKTSHIGEPDFMDFVEGGNGEEDEELCPKTAIFLDACLHPVCWPFVCYHEERERGLMAKGMKYEAAHEIANREEKQLRQRFPANL